MIRIMIGVYKSIKLHLGVALWLASNVYTQTVVALRAVIKCHWQTDMSLVTGSLQIVRS